MTTRLPLPPLDDHHLRVTRTPVRAVVDCTCATPPQHVHASMRAAERAALRHYIDHAPDGDEKTRAEQLLEQITTTAHKEKTA